MVNAPSWVDSGYASMFSGLFQTTGDVIRVKPGTRQSLGTPRPIEETIYSTVGVSLGPFTPESPQGADVRRYEQITEFRKRWQVIFDQYLENLQTGDFLEVAAFSGTRFRIDQIDSDEAYTFSRAEAEVVEPHGF